MTQTLELCLPSALLHTAGSKAPAGGEPGLLCLTVLSFPGEIGYTEPEMETGEETAWEKGVLDLNLGSQATYFLSFLFFNTGTRGVSTSLVCEARIELTQAKHLG